MKDIQHLYPVIFFLLQASVNAVSFEAHCSLKGVFIPDGAFTDSAGVEVEFYTQIPPSREIELVSGAIDLQLNDDLDAGLWKASGLLAGLPRTGDGQIWRGGDPVFVDTDFVIPFEAPLGDSVFSLKLSVDGRRVHQHFSDQHPPILPDGSAPPTNLGLVVHRIEVVNSEIPIKFEFIKETTQLSADATFASHVKTLAEQNQVSVFLEDRVDSSVYLSPSNLIRLQTFTYEDFTVFRKANARVRATTTIFRNNRPNFRVFRPLAIEGLALEVKGDSRSLSWTATLGETLQLQSSQDLEKWTDVGSELQSVIGHNSLELEIPNAREQKAYFVRLTRGASE